MLIITSVLALLLAASPALAVKWGGVTGEYGVKKVNISGMQFLKIGQGARAVAMGDAFTAVADDINAIFWNGSGLVHVERVAYQLNWTRFLLDTQLYSAAAVWNTRSARGEVLGIAVTSHNPKPSKETTIYQPNGTGQDVIVHNISVGLLYAIKFTDKFSFSAKANYVQEKLYTVKTTGFTVDVGSFFYTGFRSLRIAMAFRNFGPDRKSGDRAYLLPLVYNIGVAAEVYGEKGDPSYLTASVESAFFVDFEQRWHFGAEIVAAERARVAGRLEVELRPREHCRGRGPEADLRGPYDHGGRGGFAPAEERRRRHVRSADPRFCRRHVLTSASRKAAEWIENLM